MEISYFLQLKARKLNTTFRFVYSAGVMLCVYVCLLIKSSSLFLDIFRTIVVRRKPLDAKLVPNQSKLHPTPTTVQRYTSCNLTW